MPSQPDGQPTRGERADAGGLPGASPGEPVDDPYAKGTVRPLAGADPRTVGPYRLLGRLGSGGMGHVYLGQSLAGKRVAIKVIRAELADDPAFLRRFGREVSIARKISALHTAPVVDADPHANPPWFATAYIEGPSLAALVRKLGPMSSQAVLTLAAGVAEALTELHQVGLVHRDLKPSNILLTEAGAHVIDFGIALPVESTRLTSSIILGTPGFIAPERIEGHEGSPASDIFSLGACLVFAATGHPIVRESNVAAQLAQLTRGRFDLAGLPPALRPLVLRCLARDPKDRPTAPELVRTLVGAGVARPRPGWFGPAWPVDLGSGGISGLRRPWNRRRVLAYTGLATAGFAVAAAAAAGLGWPGLPLGLSNRAPATPRPRYGQVAWQAQVDHDGPVPPVVLNRERIVVEQHDAAGSATVVCVNPATGSDEWQLPGHTLQFAWGDLLVLRAVAEHMVVGVDRAGTESLSLPSGPETVLTPVTPQLLAMTAGAVTTFVDESGAVVWEYRSDAAGEGAMRVAHGAGGLWVTAVAPAGSTDIEVIAADIGSKEVAWRAELSGTPRVVSVAGALVLLTVDGDPSRCVAFATADGEIVQVEDGVWEPVAVTAGEAILRRRLERDWLVGWSQVDGRRLWEHTVNRAAIVAESPDGLTLYEIANRNLSAYDPESGVRRWSEPLPEEFRDSVAVSLTIDGEVGYVYVQPSGLETQVPPANVVALMLTDTGGSPLTPTR